MEIIGLHGSNARIIPGQTRELGRADFSDSKELTISRRHVSFFIPQSNSSLVQFEVLGLNPFYVHDKTSNEVKIFRSNEKGELRSGDMFCVSANSPVWYGLRSIENSVSEDVRPDDFKSSLGEMLEIGDGCGVVEGLQRVDCSDLDIDPVKEFGFVFMGHEFDSYPKKMIRDIKKWNWFLEEEHKDSEDDDDDDGRNVKHSQRRKRKKAIDNDDEEWTGDSEDETIIIDKSKKAQKPKYMTRSKDRGKPSKDAGDKLKKTLKRKDRDVDNEEIEEENEDDETLGGFIVDDERTEEDEEVVDDEDEEEEFEDEDDDEDE